MDPSCRELDEEQHIERPQPHGLDGEEVACDHSPPLCSEELTPGGAVPPRRRPQAGTPKDPTDGGRAHADAELTKLALNPDAPPPRVLLAEARDQVDGLRTQRRPAGTSPTVGPLPPHELTMPAKQGLRRDHERGPSVAGQRPARRGEERPIVVFSSGRVTVRRRTLTW